MPIPGRKKVRDEGRSMSGKPVHFKESAQEPSDFPLQRTGGNCQQATASSKVAGELRERAEDSTDQRWVF